MYCSFRSCQLKGVHSWVPRHAALFVVLPKTGHVGLIDSLRGQIRAVCKFSRIAVSDFGVSFYNFGAVGILTTEKSVSHICMFYWTTKEKCFCSGLVSLGLVFMIASEYPASKL